ncbi:suppressor of cytokine signaling 2-like [Megalops cyprinoides]|uniref:suppressor of cytokine signaling 2-like n=1 Tax=Megalops cyprinoides TaxID=118141 RepID=UPI0018653809|nr:suppressor of cytokine signaling 2-like [Megalops cyprinoides]
MILNPEKSLSPVGVAGTGLRLRGGGSTEDVLHLERAMTHLRESGWYWGSITAAQAKEVLGGAREGSFLLRDSSRPGYQLTLSVQTSLGPTHLRIESSGGTFGFDSLAMARPRLQRFSGAVQLVQHYALACRSRPHPSDSPTQEEEGSDRPLQLQLTRPLYRTTPSLQHLCRITINQHSDARGDLPLPGTLRAFLQEYPFLL